MKQMIPISKCSENCESCGKYYYDTYFFKWYSIITKEYLCKICIKCATRQLFGTKFKHNRKYHKWLKKLEKI